MRTLTLIEPAAYWLLRETGTDPDPLAALEASDRSLHGRSVSVDDLKAFLVRAGLSKEAFIGTGVVAACLVDVSRLALYSGSMLSPGVRLDYWLLTAAVLAAFLGALLGNRYLKKVTMRGIQRLVAVMLAGVAVGLIAGVL